ncbi:MAG: efflux RND transporter periplasmic adaptor subunit [Campylobacterota bacterium]|nr:efflux RND transporter periplasmic adaptor subunit [Campylobacterota bacterium]
MIKKITLIISLLIYTVGFSKNIVLTGTVVSDNEKIITSRFMGFVKSVNVNEGDIVKQNNTLYEIDSVDIDLKKEQAKLNVQMYQNQYNTIKINFDRYQRLFKEGVVSKFEVEQLELNTNNLNNMVKISQLRLKEINNQYQYLKIKAPNDGVIIKKMVKVGEMAIAGVPAIILSDINSLKIKAEVSEKDLQTIFIGKEVNIEIPSLKLKSLGKISAIIPSSNPMTHTFTVKVSFNKTSKVYPGMYAKVYIDLDNK